MEADEAYHGHPQTTIDQAFEGIDNSQTLHCYVSNANQNAKARIEIEMSFVSHVTLLNRGEKCCGKNINLHHL